LRRHTQSVTRLRHAESHGSGGAGSRPPHARSWDGRGVGGTRGGRGDGNTTQKRCRVKEMGNGEPETRDPLTDQQHHESLQKFQRLWNVTSPRAAPCARHLAPEAAVVAAQGPATGARLKTRARGGEESGLFQQRTRHGKAVRGLLLSRAVGHAYQGCVRGNERHNPGMQEPRPRLKCSASLPPDGTRGDEETGFPPTPLPGREIIRRGETPPRIWIRAYDLDRIPTTFLSFRHGIPDLHWYRIAHRASCIVQSIVRAPPDREIPTVTKQAIPVHRNSAAPRKILRPSAPRRCCAGDRGSVRKRCARTRAPSRAPASATDVVRRPVLEPAPLAGMCRRPEAKYYLIHPTGIPNTEVPKGPTPAYHTPPAGYSPPSVLRWGIGPGARHVFRGTRFWAAPGELTLSFRVGLQRGPAAACAVPASKVWLRMVAVVAGL